MLALSDVMWKKHRSPHIVVYLFYFCATSRATVANTTHSTYFPRCVYTNACSLLYIHRTAMDSSSFCFLVVDAIAPGMKMRRLFWSLAYFMWRHTSPEKERYNTQYCSELLGVRYTLRTHTPRSTHTTRLASTTNRIAGGVLGLFPI